jgi:hypothetical protein
VWREAPDDLAVEAAPALAKRGPDKKGLLLYFDLKDLLTVLTGMNFSAVLGGKPWSQDIAIFCHILKFFVRKNLLLTKTFFGHD